MKKILVTACLMIASSVFAMAQQKISVGDLSISSDGSGNLSVGNLKVSGLTSGNCVQASTGGSLTTASGPCGTSSGTLTATGTPASGNLAFFSGATSLTNGNLTGDVTTSDTSDTSVIKLHFGATQIPLGAAPTTSQCLSYNGTNITGATCGSGSMVYPGAGIAVSTGSAWTTSIAVPDGNSAHYLNGSGGWTTPAGSGSMTWPVAAGIAVYSGSSSWSTSKTSPTGDIVGTTDTQTLTNKTVDTATATEISYVHGVTSSIQTQLDSKLSSTPANISVVINPGNQIANSCSSTATATMTGLTTSMLVMVGYTSSPSALTGWGGTGGMTFKAWPSATNTVSYILCNQTSSSINYSGITFRIGAR